MAAEGFSPTSWSYDGASDRQTCVADAVDISVFTKDAAIGDVVAEVRTPAPMSFLRDICARPASERPLQRPRPGPQAARGDRDVPLTNASARVVARPAQRELTARSYARSRVHSRTSKNRESPKATATHVLASRYSQR